MDEMAMLADSRLDYLDPGVGLTLTTSQLPLAAFLRSLDFCRGKQSADESFRKIKWCYVFSCLRSNK
jgi:hypothetical protein